MNAQKIEISQLDVSPALETGSLAPLSTHWIPLHELLAHWTETDMLLALPTPVAPLLTAIGHALFALAQETRALRLYTLAWQKQQWHAAPVVIGSRAGQAMRHLHEATHHWSRAAYSLDTLLPCDLDDPAALARARQLSRIARTQQERLWTLIEEVQADIETWRAPQPEQEQQEVSA
ncbi:MAG: hypothetical protein ACRDIV_15605 [Ktedonobacteraceae bacterium]